MRVLVDENTAVQLMGPLRHLLPRHEIAHVSEIRWKGKKDRPLLRDAKQAGFDVFITRDHNQLSDPQECKAIKDSGLHHVRFSQRREGLAGLASALGSVIAAMPAVMEELEQAAPGAHRQPGSRSATFRDHRPEQRPAQLLASSTRILTLAQSLSCSARATAAPVHRPHDSSVVTERDREALRRARRIRRYARP